VQISSKYRTLLAFISGATIQSGFQESKIENSPEQELYHYSGSNQSSILSDEEWNTLGFSPNFNKGTVPTLNGVVSKVSREKHITLDRIQYVAYEVICSSFLLNLINEGLVNKNDIASGFAISQEEREDEGTYIILEKVVEKLKELGAKE